MHKIFCFIFLFVLIYGCSSPKKVIDNTGTTLAIFDLTGVYAGVLPCADCSGIKTTLTLLPDTTYKLSQTYQDTGNDSTFSHRGSFVFNNDTIITGNKTKYSPSKYLFAKSKLVKLDLNGKRIDGKLAEKYILTKQENAPTFEGFKWYLAELNGNKTKKGDKKPFILLKMNKERFFANAGCNSIHGVYKLSKTNRVIFSKIASTKMACEKMEVEQKFLSMLNQVTAYELTNDTLTLKDGKEALSKFVLE